MNKTIKQLVLALITIIIFVILFSTINFQDAIRILKQANWVYLVYAAILSLLFPVLCAIRWHYIVLRLGTNLGIWQSYKLIMAAWPLSTVTPAKSGDLVKVLFLKNVLSYSHTTGVVLAERIVDVFCLAALALLGGLVIQEPIAIFFGAFVLACCIAGVALLNTSFVNFIPKKYQTLFQNVIAASQHIYSHLPTLVLVLAITSLNWYLSILQTWLAYKALGVTMPQWYMVAILPVTIFVGLLPITIAGMGTRDSAIIYLFLPYASKEASLAVGILYSIFGYWLLTLLGMPFMKGAFEGNIRGIGGDQLKERVYEKPDPRLPG